MNAYTISSGIFPKYLNGENIISVPLAENETKVIIAISGKFTLNAVEKIIEGIQEYPLKNNLIFLDGEKIESLMSKYSRF